jgi:hypothetical protein
MREPLNQSVARPSIVPMPDEQRGEIYPESVQAEWVSWVYFFVCLAGAGGIAYLVYIDLLRVALAKIGAIL